MNTRKNVILALLTTTALMLSYIESLIPFFLGVPGMKLGLANLAVVFCIYQFGLKEAALLNFMRIVLSGLLFGNMFSILFSLSGAAVSFAAMVICKKIRFSIYGVSISGGVFHNIGQLLVAVFIVQNVSISIYGPFLLISGLITGAFIGYISITLLKYTDRILRK